MPARKSTGGGLDAVFEAIDGLSYREHHSLAKLLAMQAEERDLTDPDVFAELIADATDSFLEEGEGEE